MKGIYIRKTQDNYPNLDFIGTTSSATITMDGSKISIPTGIKTTTLSATSIETTDFTTDSTTSGELVVGNTTDNVAISTNGLITLNGQATVYDDLRFPATAINPQGAPNAMEFDATNIGFTAVYNFNQAIAVIAQLPHSWKIGSAIYPHIHWQPMTTNVGNVVWRIDYKWTNTNEVESSNWNVVELVTESGGVANKSLIAAFDAIAGTNKTISSILTIVVYRLGTDVRDTYTGTVLIKEFDIHYEIDAIGSNQQYIK